MPYDDGHAHWVENSSVHLGTVSSQILYENDTFSTIQMKPTE